MLDDTLHNLAIKMAEEKPDFCEEDLDKLFDKAVQKLPDMAAMLWGTIQENREETLFHNRLAMEGFVKRNVFHWREGLDLMEILGAIAQETGEAANEPRPADDEAPLRHKPHVLLRLHAKALQVYWEIFCLLKNGFADGALARWRTLHETAVVASLLSEHGDDLAERFMLHGHIQSWRNMKTYQSHAEALGQAPFTAEEEAEAEQQCRALISQYGKAYDGNYGWAASVIPNPRGRRVTLADIEAEVETDHYKPYYKWACQHVHSGPNAFNSLGNLGDDEIVIAGPSNAGHADPAQLAASSLGIATAALTSLCRSWDVLLGCEIVNRLVPEVREAFLRIHDEMEDEQAEIDKQIEEGADGSPHDPL